MTKDEFIRRAKECRYSDDDIADMVNMIEEARKDGVPMQYDDLILIEQPVY